MKTTPLSQRDDVAVEVAVVRALYGDPSERRLAHATQNSTSEHENPPELPPGIVRFDDRGDAGRRLTALLEPYRDAHPVVVGIPRGGTPVAAVIARSLGAPLDIAVVRKIGAPRNPELAIGALAEGGVCSLNDDSISAFGIPEAKLRSLIARATRDLNARLRFYRAARTPVQLTGQTAILVDDGLATGSTARAALASLRKRGAKRLILAVPVAAPSVAQALSDHADEVVCVTTPPNLGAVGYWYEDFQPTTDDEITTLLRENHRTSGH